MWFRLCWRCCLGHWLCWNGFPVLVRLNLDTPITIYSEISWNSHLLATVIGHLNHVNFTINLCGAKHSWCTLRKRERERSTERRKSISNRSILFALKQWHLFKWTLILTEQTISSLCDVFSSSDYDRFFFSFDLIDIFCSHFILYHFLWLRQRLLLRHMMMSTSMVVIWFQERNFVS